MAHAKKKTGKRIAIVVGGGPAPGINGVISAATIEAANRGVEVVGIRDGFKWLAEGDAAHVEKLGIHNTSRIHHTGGSIIGISRANPTTSPERMRNTLKGLFGLGVGYVITVGGDGTMCLANKLEKAAGGKLRVAHVPKTIDNNILIPSYIPTFGYETARHIGTRLVQYLMEDAKTTGRWYFVVTMGRLTGHLALGIGKASGATLTVIPEEFGRGKVKLSKLVSKLEGAIIKRLVMGRTDGVAILAEGLTEKLDEEDLKELHDLERDEFGRLRLSEVDIGELLKERTMKALSEKGIGVRVIDKVIGYELRSAPPIPFDAKYTRELGYSAVKFLLNGGTGALITIQTGKMVPIDFSEMIDPVKDRARIRFVDVRTEAYEVADRYMIKLREDDLSDRKKLAALARAANMKPAEFKSYFSQAVY
ncbi:MAG: 6-phosphofructokinase [Candidatus Dadabacteria bacterium]|nr:6-phosphofructokinase [Candidatus Dadabacteria bacterium]